MNRATLRAFKSPEGVLTILVVLSIVTVGPIALNLVSASDVAGTPAEPAVRTIEGAVSDVEEDYRLDQAKTERLIREEINEVREEEGLADIPVNEEIAIQANDHSRDMAVDDYVDHKTPEGQTTRGRYPCESVGEVIYKTYWRTEMQNGPRLTSEAAVAHTVVDGWMDSIDHRQILLRPGLAYQGAGVAMDGNEVYVTVGFC